DLVLEPGMEWHKTEIQPLARVAVGVTDVLVGAGFRIQIRITPAQRAGPRTGRGTDLRTAAPRTTTKAFGGLSQSRLFVPGGNASLEGKAGGQLVDTVDPRRQLPTEELVVVVAQAGGH